MRVLMSVTTWDAERIKSDLVSEGFPVSVAEDGTAIFESLDLLGQPVVLMETDLPDVKWQVALEKLRAETPGLSVLVIDSHGCKEDRLRALQLGADDIIGIDMSTEEIISRILSVTSRRAGHSGPNLYLGPLKVNLRHRRVWWGPQAVHLSPAQYTIFEALCLGASQTVCKDDLMGELYGLEDASAPRTIDVFITHLRARMVAAGAPANLIETVRGRGYSLVEPDTAEIADDYDMSVEELLAQSAPLDRAA